MKFDAEGKLIGATAKERLLAYSIKDAATGCWNWTRMKDKDGYGKTRIGKGMGYAHRLSYIAFIGPIPEGQKVLHKCDNRQCVNPEHLWIGTQSDNLADMYKKGRANLSGLNKGVPTEILKKVAASMVRENGRFARRRNDTR